MKKYVALFIAAVAVVAVTFACFGAPIFAQAAPTTQAPAPAVKPDPVALTAEQESTLENKVIKAELMARELSPDALGKAIAEMIAAKQQAYQQVTQDLTAYTQTLAMDGTELRRDPKTGKFARVKKE